MHSESLLMMMSFICSCRNKNQPKAIYLKALFVGWRALRALSSLFAIFLECRCGAPTPSH